MRHPTTKPILAAVLALAVAGSASAFGHGMGGGRGCGHGMFLGGGRMLHALDLNADQEQKVQDILAAHRPKLRQLATGAQAARQQVVDKLLGGGTVTQPDLDVLAQQASQARTDLMGERLAVALEVRNVLTPEQIQKAATIRASMKQLHAQMRQLLGGQSTD